MVGIKFLWVAIPSVEASAEFLLFLKAPVLWKIPVVAGVVPKFISGKI